MHLIHYGPSPNFHNLRASARQDNFTETLAKASDDYWEVQYEMRKAQVRNRLQLWDAGIEYA